MTPLSDRLLEALAASAVREGLVDAVFTRVATPFGRLLVVQGAGGVVRVGFEEDPEDVVLAEVARGLGPRVIASETETAVVRDALSAYLEGEDERLEVPVDLGLVQAPFRRSVLETLHRDVGRGQIVTYGALAARSGHPKAARAVGTACARNPVPIIVPCHRVVPGSGGVGSHGGGPALKRALLEFEGAMAPRLAPG
jgi:methylated-DNA-[protein]-cysteine S-methyltransferase